MKSFQFLSVTLFVMCMDTLSLLSFAKADEIDVEIFHFESVNRGTYTYWIIVNQKSILEFFLIYLYYIQVFSR